MRNNRQSAAVEGPAPWPGVLTEPFELGALRAADDPLGLRAATSRLGGYLFSPITSRTTSVRQLGIFTLCAAASRASDSMIVNRDRFVVLARLITIAATRALEGRAGELAESVTPLTSLPGRQHARRIAARIRRYEATKADLAEPILSDELSQGLWGRYATLAARLGFLDGPRLTDDGEKMSETTRRKILPNVTEDGLAYMVSQEPLGAELVLAAKFNDVLKRDVWPVTPGELAVAHKALSEQQRGDVVVAVLGSVAGVTRRAVLGTIVNGPAARLRGANGQPMSELARLARLGQRAVDDVERQWRDRVISGVDGDVPPTAHLAPLFEWCRTEGLDAGTLAGQQVTWAALDALHERAFRRRGQKPWTRMEEWELALLPPDGGPVELRLNAVKSLAEEGLGRVP